jgi:hypothetical protein
MADPIGMLSSLRQVRWDSPFRLGACLLGLTLLLGRPTEVISLAASRLGFRLEDELVAASDWLNDPARQDGVAAIAGVLITVGVLATCIHGRNFYGRSVVTIGATRAGATNLVGLALSAEVHSLPHQALFWSVVVTLMLALVINLTRAADGESSLMLQGFVGETVAALIWLPLTVLAWCVGRETGQAPAT